MARFGLLSKEQPHSNDIDHCIWYLFNLKVTESLTMRLAQFKYITVIWLIKLSPMTHLGCLIKRKVSYSRNFSLWGVVVSENTYLYIFCFGRALVQGALRLVLENLPPKYDCRLCIVLCWNYIYDPSQMRTTFYFFWKSGVLRKTSLTL